MPTKTQVNERAHKVKWALDDIMAECKRARRGYGLIKPLVLRRRNHDATTALLEIIEAIETIERKARNARAGRYEE